MEPKEGTESGQGGSATRVLSLFLSRFPVNVTRPFDLFFLPFLISLNRGTDERNQMSLCNYDLASKAHSRPRIQPDAW